MIGTIYLIGGGEVREGDTKLIDQDISSLAPKNAEFVFFGAASEDSRDYANTIKSVFGSHFKVTVVTREKGKDYAIRAMKSASVIYLGGGTTDLLLELFSEWDIKDDLISAMQNGTHIAGMSAGAHALSAYYIHEKDDVLCIEKGWGLVFGCVYVHAIQDSLAKAKELWANHDVASQHPFIAVSENTAWRISPKVSEKVGNGEVWLANNE